jgi:hypothetical protein
MEFKFNDFSTPEKKCCLKMKEVLQAQVYEEAKDMTDEEILVYFHTSTNQSFLNGLKRKNKLFITYSI